MIESLRQRPGDYARRLHKLYAILYSSVGQRPLRRQRLGYDLLVGLLQVDTAVDQVISGRDTQPLKTIFWRALESIDRVTAQVLGWR